MPKKSKTPFYQLALDGDLEAIRKRLLIEAPGPQTNDFKRTPLMGAAMKLRLDAVRLLAPHSDPFYVDAFGHSFWDFCARAPELMKMALECFDPQAHPDTVPSPLIQCISSSGHPNQKERMEALRLLIPRSDPNAVWKGKTALETMADSLQWEMADELAPFCARDHALVIFSFAGSAGGGSKMPRFKALLEAEALAEVLSIRAPAQDAHGFADPMAAHKRPSRDSLRL